MRLNFAILLTACALICRTGGAQTTISDRPFDVTVGNGLWGVFLPDYEIGTDGEGEPVLTDNGDFLGYQGDLRLIRRFLHTRTSVEARVFYGAAQTSESNSVTSVDVGGDLGETSIVLGEGISHIQSDIDHYGYDLGLRDTWKTRFGGFSAGCLFSYMIFDQNYEISHGTDQILNEELTSEFIGGKATFGWDGYIRDCPSILDLSIGFHQLRSDYLGRSPQFTTQSHEHLYANPTTIEAAFTTFKSIRDVRIGTTFAVTHLGDMPQIIRGVGETPTIRFDDGLMLRLMFEILL